MSLVIANNISSLTAQNHLTRASAGLAGSIERLASGLRVNRGADNPAALVISERQRAQIAGLKQAIENSEKAVSLVQTAEGALSEINTLLLKIRALAIDSANVGANDDAALAANQAEIENAIESINRIANNTQFGTKKLLNGEAGVTATTSDANVKFLKAAGDTMAGAYAVNITTSGERAAVVAGVAQTTNLAADETLTVNGVAITLNAGLSQTQVVERINEFSAQTGVVADVAAGMTRLYTSSFGLAATIQVVSNTAAAANSSGFGTTILNDAGVDIVGTIGGVSFTGAGNILTATSGAAKGLTLQLAASPGDATSTVSGAQGNVTVVDNALVFQIGANRNQTAKVSIGTANASSLGVGVWGNQFNNLGEINITSSPKSQDAIAVIDKAIDDVTSLRGVLGAFQQNTLSSTANNLRTTLENVTAAESVIRDTDFAAEIANFTRQQVLVQAGISVLSSANQIPQQVLALLN